MYEMAEYIVYVVQHAYDNRINLTLKSVYLDRKWIFASYLCLFH